MSVKNSFCLIADDADLCRSLTASLKSAAMSLMCIDNVKQYLKTFADIKPHGCLIADGKMTGLETLKELSQHKIVMPVIVLVPHGAVSAAVQALKAGAIDAIEKPIKSDVLHDSVRKAATLYGRMQKLIEEREIACERIDSLTPRETQVIQLMVQGKPNRQIAAQLGISPKTLDIHRSNVMDKMEAETVGELCRAYLLNKTDTAYLHILL